MFQMFQVEVHLQTLFGNLFLRKVPLETQNMLMENGSQLDLSLAPVFPVNNQQQIMSLLNTMILMIVSEKAHPQSKVKEEFSRRILQQSSHHHRVQSHLVHHQGDLLYHPGLDHLHQHGEDRLHQDDHLYHQGGDHLHSHGEDHSHHQGRDHLHHQEESLGHHQDLVHHQKPQRN